MIRLPVSIAQLPIPESVVLTAISAAFPGAADVRMISQLFRGGRPLAWMGALGRLMDLGLVQRVPNRRAVFVTTTLGGLVASGFRPRTGRRGEA